MKLKRTHTIRALLLVYLGISAAVCIALSSYIPDGENASDKTVISSAPLDLPQDIQQQVEKDLNPSDATPEATAEPEPADTVEPEPEDTPPQTSGDTETETPPKNTGHVSTKHAGARVNVRAAADPDSKIIASVYDEDEVTVLSESGKWYEIQTGDITGYIHRNYLVPADE